MTPKTAKGLEYTRLSDAHARQVLEERLTSLEHEHYNNALNLTISGDNPELAKQAEEAQRNLNFIEHAHAIVLAELEKLPPQPEA